MSVRSELIREHEQAQQMHAIMVAIQEALKKIPPPPPRYPPGVAKGPLKSRYFALPIFASARARLQAAADSHPMHIMPGTKGFHVAIVHHALDILQPFVQSIPCPTPRTNTEKSLGFYGGYTEAKVLLYKKKLAIINKDYQSKPDKIVGIMTMRSLDFHLQAVDEYHPGWLESVTPG
jgi:hypothetical protein